MILKIIKAVFFSLLLLIGAGNLAAQNCHCADEFLFLQAHIEKDYAGFKDKVRPGNRAAYEAFSRDMLGRARLASKAIYCQGLMREWLAFFRDDHIQLVKNGDAPAPDSLAVIGLMKATEVVSVSPQQLAALKRDSGVEGFYYNDDSTYRIALIKNKTYVRDYAGVVLTSKTAFWKPGEVKLELKALPGNRYLGYLYIRDHSVQLSTFHFDGQSFTFSGAGWRKEGATANRSVDPGYVNVASKKLTDRTLYIRIGTFEDDNARAIDSVFALNQQVLRSTPYLILDLRGNGGESDFAYDSITPWLYTNPIRRIGQDVLATEDNIKGWRWIIDNIPDFPPALVAETKAQIVRMQEHPGEYVHNSDDTTIISTRIERYPEKVVVLIDEGCASSTEEFLLDAIQSRKVTLMGQHTDGAIDYTNMRPLALACMPLTLWVATTRSRRVDLGKGLDNKGIEPRILLTKDKDWIEEARKYLER